MTFQDVVNADRLKLLNEEEFAVSVTYQKGNAAAQTGVSMVLGASDTSAFIQDVTEGKTDTQIFTFSKADITNAATGDTTTDDSIVYKLTAALEVDPYMEVWETVYRPAEKRSGKR